jgi:hypothetical protein
LVRLLKGISKEDKKNVRRWYREVFDSFQCITCYQRLSDGCWTTEVTSAPKTCKKKWRVRPRCCTSGCWRSQILCCGAKQNYHYVEEMDSSRDYDEKLAVYGQGLCGAPTLACHVLCRQRKWEAGCPSLSFHCSWGYQRPLPRALLTNGRRFLKRPGVEVWDMPQLETSTTAG